eukprot:SRR837773.320.p1 GENE.SRR837773.320~~SRR837773.320.p1  ORF type:complete len:509 (+),score=256.24 SRR837773.320:170-1528(+)
MGALRRVTTKEATGVASEDDLLKLAQVFDACQGDLHALASKFELSLELMTAESSRPADGRDFAKRLLMGQYCADRSDMALKKLRQALQEDLQHQFEKLKRVKTKEGSGPSEDDVIFASTVYTQYQGDADQIAAACGISAELLKLTPPLDAVDFGHNLLEGKYTADLTPQQLEKLRADLKEKQRKDEEAEKRRAMLSRGASKLTRTGTKSMEASPEQLQLTAKLYDKYGGDLKKLAYVCGLTEASLQQNPPADGKDFAQRLLSGVYAGANVADLSVMLQKQRGSLLRVRTKESLGKVSSADVQAIAKLYTENDGDLDRLSKLLQIPLDVLQRRPPSGGEDFAERLLEGAYHPDMDAVSKQNLREALRGQLQHQMSSLRRTNTKTGTGEASPEDVRALDDLYTKHGGKLEDLAKACGADLDMMQRKPPKDGADFAKTCSQVPTTASSARSRRRT